MGKLERASIQLLQGDGKDSGKKDGDPIPVCFNPKEYSLDKSVTWGSESAFTDAPDPEYTKSSPMTLSVTLQFDTYEERVSVREKYTLRLEKAAKMRGELKKDSKAGDKAKASPPVLLFQWGTFIFKGVVESMSQKYTMFLSNGTPVRAEVSLKIRNVWEVQKEEEKKFTAPSDQTEIYTVQKGDRLDSIAAEKLGDASRWTEIALLSGIDDPLNLPSTVTIPKK